MEASRLGGGPDNASAEKSRMAKGIELVKRKAATEFDRTAIEVSRVAIVIQTALSFKIAVILEIKKLLVLFTLYVNTL